MGLLLVEATAYFSADQASDRLVEERAGGDLKALVAGLGAQVTRAFAEHESALLDLASARGGGLDDASLRRWLGGLSRTPFDAAALHRADGRTIASFADGVEGANEPDIEFLRPLFLNATTTRPAHRIDATVDPPMVATVVAVREPDGRPGGFLSARVAFSRFAPDFTEARYAEDGFAYFAAADGTVVYAPVAAANARLIGLPVRDGFAERGEEPWLVASEPAGPGYVVFAVSKGQVTAQLDAVGNALLVAIGGTSLLLLVAVIITVNRTLRPILRIVPAAARVKEGDFSVRVRHASDDEMGQLADSFNSMVESLEARDRQLTAYARDLKRSSEDFQTAIDTLSSAIASTLNAAEVMEVACHECVRILRIDAAYLFLRTDDPLEPARLTARAPKAAPDFLGDAPGETTLVAEVLASGRHVLFNRFTTATVRFPRGLGAGVKSALAVPLALDGKVEGCLLLLDTVSPIRFTEQDVPKATIFAQHVAVAIRNSEFFEEAETERRKYQAVVENANDGILVRVGDQLVFANSSLKRMLDVDTFPMSVDAFFARYVDPDEIPKLHERYERRVHGDTTQMMYETRFVASDGHFVPVEINARVITYDGKPASQMFVRNLTEQKRSQEELAKRTELLLAAEKLAAIGSLAAGVAHEINNPLAFIKGNEQLSQDILKELQANPAIPEPTKALLKEIDDSITVNLTGIVRIERIVASLRQFAKPSPEKQQVDTNGVVESTLILSANKIKNRIQVEKELAATLPPVMGNPDELGQVLLNLVLNAVDACPEGHGVIRIRSFTSGSNVVVEVEDNGQGIPPEVQRRIFDPFYTTKKHGTGLGLSISHRIVTDHGGTLTFRTAPGAGTTFTIRLPAVTARSPSIPQRGS